MPSTDIPILATALAAGVSIGYLLASNIEKKKAIDEPTPKGEPSKQCRPKGSSTGVSPKKGTRKYLIGGNWKCNGDIETVDGLINLLNSAGPIPAHVEVVIAPTCIHIAVALASLREDISVAAQNCGLNPKTGAFTGEICPSQLVDAGITWVILGHSERREGFGMAGEDSELVAKKVKTAVDAGLNVMFCIGEKKEEREKGVTNDVCAKQMEPTAKLLKKEDWAKVAIAYEPVWAIGTGLTATPEMAQKTHKAIRGWISQNVSPEVASSIRIQYGGSMKGANAAGLLAQEDIDGGLIGSAALKPDFVNIFNAAPAP